MHTQQPLQDHKNTLSGPFGAGPVFLHSGNQKQTFLESSQSVLNIIFLLGRKNVFTEVE